MKNYLFKSLTVLILFSLITSCNYNDEASDVTFACIDFHPFTYKDSKGDIVGAEADMLSVASAKLGFKPTFEMFDLWSEAYDTTLNGKMRGLITTAYTPERKDLFKWAGPLNRVPFYIATSADSGIGVSSLKEAMELSSIAVIKDWAETIELEKLGFTNLDYCNSMEEMIAKLMNGECQAINFAMPGKDFKVSVGVDEYILEDFKIGFKYHTAFYYIAFSKDVPDSIVDEYQFAIDEMLLSGTATTTRNKYFTYNFISYGKIQLLTEENPPFNYTNGVQNAFETGKLDFFGSSVEIVDAIQSYLGVDNPIIPVPWFSGFDIVKYLPYSAIFTTVRNEGRENMFQWVGPIATGEPVFCSRKSSGINLTSIDDAKNYTVAVVKDWADETTLKENGFTDYVTGDGVESTFKLFANGEADLLFIKDLSIPYLSGLFKIDIEDLETIGFFDSRIYYIAFSNETPAYIVENWQTALDTLKVNGAFGTIWNKWYPGISMP